MKKALSAALLGAGLGLGFTEELYRYVFCRSGSPLFSALPKKQTHDEAYYSHRDGEAARLRALPQERFEIRSSRGARLVGHYFHGEGDGKRIAFLIHGYRSEHAETAGMSWDYYRSRGFDLFCCDHEAHGESGGKYIGFGCFGIGFELCGRCRLHCKDSVRIYRKNPAQHHEHQACKYGDRSRIQPYFRNRRRSFKSGCHRRCEQAGSRDQG